MPQSVYTVIELIGTSPRSWGEAAKAAVAGGIELTGFARGRGGRTGRGDQGRQGRGLLHQDQGLLQIWRA
jgi:Dodecin